MSQHNIVATCRSFAPGSIFHSLFLVASPSITPRSNSSGVFLFPSLFPHHPSFNFSNNSDNSNKLESGLEEDNSDKDGLVEAGDLYDTSGLISTAGVYTILALVDRVAGATFFVATAAISFCKRVIFFVAAAKSYVCLAEVGNLLSGAAAAPPASPLPLHRPPPHPFDEHITVFVPIGLLFSCSRQYC